MAKTSLGLEENVAGALSYVLWWLTGIVFYILEKDNRVVKFHAMQSILVFLPLMVIIIIISFIPVVGWILSWLITVLSVLLWLILMLKAYQGGKFKLPVVGDIAEKNA